MEKKTYYLGLEMEVVGELSKEELSVTMQNIINAINKAKDEVGITPDTTESYCDKIYITEV